MRIGIDVTPLPPQPVGAGQYILHFVKALAELDQRPELVLFVQENKLDLFNITSTDNLHWVKVPNHTPGVRLLWEQIGLPQLVRKYRVDLLHSLHYTRPLWLSCKSVVTFHDMTFFLFPRLHTVFKRAFFPLAMRASAWFANAIIADSESTRKDTIRLMGVTPDKISTVHLGISPDFHPSTDSEQLNAVRQKYTLPSQFILYVGLVEPRKNLPGLLRAYHQVVAQGDKIPLVIVGRFGWMYEEVLQQINTLNLEELVHFTGYVSQSDLPIIYQLAKIMVYPSLYEGFGLPVLEAMACGTPVITSNVASMPEIVGDAGLLLPPGNDDALAEGIITLLSDSQLQQEFRSKGLQKAAYFTWERTACETLKIYQRVLQIR